MKFCIFYIIFMTILFHTIKAHGLDMEAIKQIESGGNPNAYNEHAQAKGLYQITPICLKEYNNYHEEKIKNEDLFNEKLNYKIAKWYLDVRIPQMLKYYGKRLTNRNKIISYNAGISYVVENKDLPKETENYIIKYNKITKGGRL